MTHARRHVMSCYPVQLPHHGFMSTARLQINLGRLNDIPYDERWKNRSSNEGEQGPVQSLRFYLMKSLIRHYASREERELPDYGQMPRLAFSAFSEPNDISAYYPAKIVANTSPLKWFLMCRLFQNLPDELRTFTIPLSDPYVPLFQSLRFPKCAGYSFVTCLSLGRTTQPDLDIDDKIIPILLRLNTLQALDLNGSKVTTSGLRQLQTAGLQGQGGVRRGPTRLKVLMLGNCRLIDDQIVGVLKTLHHLRYLDLRSSGCCADISDCMEDFSHTIPTSLISTTERFHASQVLKRLHSLSQDESPSDLYIMSIERLDYRPSKTRRQPAHQTYAEGFYCCFDWNQKTVKIGDPETLVKVQERPQGHERSFPSHLYDAAEGVRLRMQGQSASKQHNNSQTSRQQPAPHILDERLDDLRGDRWPLWTWEKKEEGLYYRPQHLAHESYQPPRVPSSLRPKNAMAASVAPKRDFTSKRLKLAESMLRNSTVASQGSQMETQSDLSLSQFRNPFRPRAA